jgi:hypothetical protein
MWYCTNCRESVADGSDKCWKCGKPKEAAGTTEPELQTQPAAPRPGFVDSAIDPPLTQNSQAEPMAPPAPTLPRAADRFTGGPFSWLLLTIAQVVLVLVCLAFPLGMIFSLAQLSKGERVLAQQRQILARQNQLVLGRNSRTAVVGQNARVANALRFYRVAVLVGGIAGMCVSGALVVVIKRAKAAASIAAIQDQENERIWKAIRNLQGSDS